VYRFSFKLNLQFLEKVSIFMSILLRFLVTLAMLSRLHRGKLRLFGTFLYCSSVIFKSKTIKFSKHFGISLRNLMYYSQLMKNMVHLSTLNVGIYTHWRSLRTYSIDRISKRLNSVRCLKLQKLAKCVFCTGRIILSRIKRSRATTS